MNKMGDSKLKDKIDKLSKKTAALPDAPEFKSEEIIDKKDVATLQKMNTNFDKVKTITDQLNKHYKKNLIRTGDQIPTILKVKWDEPSIDYVSDGGLPIGRYTEFLGIEHSGKTRNALIMMRKFQLHCFNCNNDNALNVEWEVKDGTPKLKRCTCKYCKSPKTSIQVFVDIEGTTDPKFMGYFDIDVNGILYFRPDRPSSSVDIVDTYLKNPLIGLIILDSVGATGADSEVENAMEDIKMNQNAVFFNRACRKWQSSLNFNSNEDIKSPTTLLVINQSYSTIGTYSTEVPQGGRGMRHGKGMCLKTRIVEKTKNAAEEITGVHIAISNEKNKTGMPYRKAEYYLNLDPASPVGYCKVDLILQLCELSLVTGVVIQKGGWYYYGEYKFHGKDALLETMRTNDEFAEEIKAKMNIA